MKRRPFIAGNWKMNGTLAGARELARTLTERLKEMSQRSVEAALCPPHVHLAAVAEILRDSSVALGAQDAHWEERGAYTGETSPVMLRELGCTYVILGHSERRHVMGEPDERIGRKVRAALRAGLKPILCVGETLQERQADRTIRVVQRQLETGLTRIEIDRLAHAVIAYEPVWAIGTGHNATPNQAQEVHAFIRQWLFRQFGSDPASKVRIQYGGSVKPDNAANLLSQPDVDGALVGGASLKADSFVPIVEAALQTARTT